MGDVDGGSHSGYGHGHGEAGYGMLECGEDFEKMRKKLRTKVDIATRLEMLRADGIVWIVLLNAEQGKTRARCFLWWIRLMVRHSDKDIAGTELADNLGDERIGEIFCARNTERSVLISGFT